MSMTNQERDAMFLDEMTRHLERWRPIDISECGSLRVSYQPTQLEEPTEWHVEMLRPAPDPDRIFCDATNRAAVTRNLDEFVREFDRAYRSQRWIESGHSLESWRDLLRLNLQHVTAARRHVTNGQTTVTIVELGDGRYSVAHHDGLERFIGSFIGLPSLVAARLTLAESEDEALAVAGSWVSEADESTVAVMRHGVPATMTWRTWGEMAAADGYSIAGLVLTLDGHCVWTELEPRMGAAAEPYAVLNSLSAPFPGVQAATCATCHHFAFSSMSRDMTGGWSGYCTLPNPAGGTGSSVSVLHRCASHALITDTQRACPYLAPR